MRIACIILAAGESRRMGFPKAFLDLGDGSALRRIIRTFRSCGAAGPLVVVTRADLLEAMRLEVERTEVTMATQVVANPSPEAGRTGSLQVGVAALRSLALPGAGKECPDDVDACWIWPVDTPCVRTETLIELASKASQEEAARTSSLRTARRIPVHAGRGGHPLLLGNAWWETVMDSLRPDQPLRDLYEIEPETVERIEVADPAVRWNLDDPAAVQAFLKRPAAPIGETAPQASAARDESRPAT